MEKKEKDFEELKNKVRTFLGDMKIITFVGEKEKIEKLHNIINEDIDNNDIEKLYNEFNCISQYLIHKQEKLIKEKDFEYLSNIAEILRNQQVRAGDGVALANPVFKVTYHDGKEKQVFYFLTKDAAEQFIETNKIWVGSLQTEKISSDDERRKEKIFNVERNENLELERLLEIIKRNF